MTRYSSVFDRWLRETDGQDLIEYLLVGTLIAVAVVAGAMSLGNVPSRVPSRTIIFHLIAQHGGVAVSGLGYANTEGGWLVVGIADSGQVVGSEPVDV